MTRAGIIGGAGYTAGELIRLLINHPAVEIIFINSSSHAGHPVTEVHEGLIGETGLLFCDNFNLDDIDVLFLCSGHGFSSKFLEEHPLPEGLKVIDLSEDFRDESNGFVYGLPELNFDAISKASRIANPGCFATAIQLSLLPLFKAGIISDDIQISAVTGSTGAGVKPSATTHFSWRNNNLSVYKSFRHQHLKEIRRNLEKLNPDYEGRLNFIPVRGDFPRGIYAMCWTKTDLDEAAVRKLYKEYYKEAAFTFVADGPVDLKQSVNTNKAVIGIEKVDDMLLVTTAIDNLLKGASGQAVQNMNIIFGYEQTTGLRLKASAF